MFNIVGWILAILLALVFSLAGGTKLVGVPAMVAEFAQIGIGQWFRYVTGLLEVSGAIGLLIRKFRFWAALQIVAVMVGATGVNLWVLHVPALARLTVILMLLALVLAWLRRPPRRPQRG
jgi:putative oxidoreductase